MCTFVHVYQYTTVITRLSDDLVTDESATEDLPVTPNSLRYSNQDIIDNVPPTLITNSQGIKVWDNKIEEPIPYRVLDDLAKDENPLRAPMGYLAFAGYMQYSVETREGEPVKDGVKDKRQITQADVDMATQSFLRFNGFVEDGEVTDEMIEFMTRPRCGNPDLVFTTGEDSLCYEMTERDISRELTRSRRDNFFAQGDSRIFTIPGSGFKSEAVTYYFEMDIAFLQLSNGRSRAVKIAFNYDASESDQKPLEIIAIRFRLSKLCVLFLKKIGHNVSHQKGTPESCYTPTKNEQISRKFKIRLNVYEAARNMPGKCLVTIRGRDVAENVFLSPSLSSVMVITKSDQEVTLARICKQTDILDSDGLISRKKRYVPSVHRWDKADQTIKFNFQNYSAALGQERTRDEVFKALRLYSKETGLDFQEVAFDSKADIIFMFIKGHHADQKPFHSMGNVKAHAFTPVHGEIHFNDHENFSVKEGDGLTSMFYTAAHEIGHAMGVRHSQVKEALMAEGYPEETAFTFSKLHEDDKRALNFHYGSGQREGKVLAGVNLPEPDENVEIHPNIDFPHECHKRIDAALAIGENPRYYFLISGPFLWRFTEESEGDGIKSGFVMSEGYPRRVQSIFKHATDVDAMFSVRSKDREMIYIIQDGGKYYSVYYFNQLSPNTVSISAKDFDKKEISNTKFDSIDIKIKAAFQHNDRTVLVADSLERYYEIIWDKFRPRSINEEQSMKQLIGRNLAENDFNAAMSYANKDLLVFRNTLVFHETKFPKEGSESQSIDIEQLFGITGWCTNKANIG